MVGLGMQVTILTLFDAVSSDHDLAYVGHVRARPAGPRALIRMPFVECNLIDALRTYRK